MIIGATLGSHFTINAVKKVMNQFHRNQGKPCIKVSYLNDVVIDIELKKL